MSARVVYETRREGRYVRVLRNGVRVGSCATLQNAVSLAKARAWREPWGTAAVRWTNGDGSVGYFEYGGETE